MLGKAPSKAIRKTLAYARVSSWDQKSDLTRQENRLTSYCSDKGWDYELISDLGSGLNYEKKGLKKLIRQICNREVCRLVIAHKDRLLRFGSALLFRLCEHFGCEVIILESTVDQSFEQVLTADVIEIMTVFTARVHGRRSHETRRLKAQAA